MFLPGESQGRRSLVGYRLWGRTESDMTERLRSSSSKSPVLAVGFFTTSATEEALLLSVVQVLTCVSL